MQEEDAEVEEDLIGVDLQQFADIGIDDPEKLIEIHNQLKPAEKPTYQVRL